MLYFSYGMNTNLASMAHRCPAARSLGYARLLDHRFRFATHADVEPCKGTHVDGVLWEITPHCLESLDILEGYPHYYGCEYRPVEVRGKLQSALVYFMQPGVPSAPPHQGYFNMVLEGYRSHGVPVSQLFPQ
jgi:gamma-glutamylcyclotransferase (GGCT)/AIG2-like uncharacterized protein YtfP